MRIGKKTKRSANIKRRESKMTFVLTHIQHTYDKRVKCSVVL